MRKLLYLVLALVSLSVAASCIDRPDIVLDEDQMIDLLVDVHRAEGLLEMQLPDRRLPNNISNQTLVQRLGALPTITAQGCFQPYSEQSNLV